MRDVAYYNFFDEVVGQKHIKFRKMLFNMIFMMKKEKNLM
jgi:hypothetical protein